MKYTNREDFQQLCRNNVRYNRTRDKKFTRCHDAFWLRMYPKDRAISDNISAHGYWEPWDAMAITNTIYDKRTWTFIDVGANIGYYSMIGAEAGLEVHAFECNPNMIEYISDSAHLNRFSVKIHEVALGDEDGTATLSVNYENLGGASLITQPVVNETFEVEVTTLDKAMSDLNKDFVIKVDVEGYERNVWWGSKDLRNRLNNIWFMEWFNTRWTREEQAEFLREVESTHKLNTTTMSGFIKPATVDQILDMPFATLVFIKR